MENKTVRLVVVGDGAVGKTCLLHVFAKGEFPEKYIPTIFDNYSSEIELNNQTINFLLMDTAGQVSWTTLLFIKTCSGSYDHIRPLSYPDANVFLLCFSIDSPTSLENIKNKWVPEVRKHRPNCPFVLVGTKADIRNDRNMLAKLRDQGVEPVSAEAANQISKSIKAVKFMECSAMLNDGVREVFEEALYNGMYPPTEKVADKKKGSCLLL